MKKLNYTVFLVFFYFLLYFRFFILRSKTKLNLISVNHTSSQVNLTRKRLILRGSYPRPRQGHTSDIYSNSYRRFNSGVPAHQHTSLTFAAGQVYTFSFSFWC